MISAGDFRNGVTFEEDGNVLQVIEFQHVKPGKGAAFVRTKTKNVITGSVVEKSYNPSAKYPTAFIERKDMEYSYNDGDLYYFMDSETFEEEVYTGEDTAITAVYKGETGYVVETEVDGYADKITVWVGVKSDGYVTGITVRDLDETPGLGRKTASDVDFLLQFLRGTGASAVGEDIDSVTGATVSSKAVTKAVNSAVGFVTGADVSSGATEWGG